MEQVLSLSKTQRLALVGGETGAVASQNIFPFRQPGQAVLSVRIADGRAVELRQFALLNPQKHQLDSGQREPVREPFLVEADLSADRSSCQEGDGQLGLLPGWIPDDELCRSAALVVFVLSPDRAGLVFRGGVESEIEAALRVGFSHRQDKTVLRVHHQLDPRLGHGSSSFISRDAPQPAGAAHAQHRAGLASGIAAKGFVEFHHQIPFGPGSELDISAGDSAQVEAPLSIADGLPQRLAMKLFEVILGSIAPANDRSLNRPGVFRIDDASVERVRSRQLDEQLLARLDLVDPDRKEVA